MEQKLLSIYIGNDVTRICEVVKKSATSITVNNATEVSTPGGCIDDGYITDVAAIAEAIRGCVFGRGFSATKAIFTIASKKIASKEVIIPYVRGEKKISQILEANSAEYFPMSTTGDFLFAHSVMEYFQDDEGKKIRLTAVATPRDLVEGYYELADELKLAVENIDYVGNSVLQLLTLQMKDTSTELVLQIEKDVTYVNVMAGKDIILQRSVPYGKNAVINSMMEIKKMTEKEAKTLLSNRDLIDRQVTEEEYSEAVRYLISSIGRIVEYHRSRNPDRIIDGIKVFGEGSSIAGIDEVLQQELGANVTRFSTLEGVRVSGKAYLTSETALRYLANFGAVLNPIGLKMDTGKAKEQTSKDINKFLFILLALVVIVMTGLSLYKVFEYYGLKTAEDVINADIQRMQDIEVIADDYEKAVASFNTIKTFCDGTVDNNDQVLQLLLDLEALMPENTILTSFDSVDGTVKIKFMSADKESVADVIVSMKKLDYVHSYSLPNLTEKKVDLVEKNGTESKVIGRSFEDEYEMEVTFKAHDGIVLSDDVQNALSLTQANVAAQTAQTDATATQSTAATDDTDDILGGVQ
ncbi:MAG: pilus assembly protein PilM [Lachnospiraceae bacterium]|nr:pilus assembly protein PilM [Lachnospiraceae bacterium]